MFIAQHVVALRVVAILQIMWLHRPITHIIHFQAYRLPLQYHKLRSLHLNQ